MPFDEEYVRHFATYYRCSDKYPPLHALILASVGHLWWPPELDGSMLSRRAAKLLTRSSAYPDLPIREGGIFKHGLSPDGILELASK